MLRKLFFFKRERFPEHSVPKSAIFITPFPNLLVPLFQNESKCETIHTMSFIFMQIKVIKTDNFVFFYLPRQNAVDIQKLISRISGYIYTDDVTSGTKSITTQDEYKTHRSERLGKSRWRLLFLDTFFPPFPPASLPSPYGLRPSIAFEVNFFTHLCQIAV